MDRYEEAVLQLLTANGETFVAPRYELTAGWASPSLVALRPARRQVWVVEVSASGYPLGLVDRINQRIARWYAPLLEQLQRLGISDAHWSIGLLVFVRDDQMDWLRERVKDLSGVQLLSLETANCPWSWDDAVWTEDFDLGHAPVPLRGDQAKLQAPGSSALKH